MGIKIGNIDIVNEVIELHFQVLRTQLLLEEIIKKNNIRNLPSHAEMNAIEDRVLEVLNKKFPDMGIKKN
jgi:hypothetical protein